MRDTIKLYWRVLKFLIRNRRLPIRKNGAWFYRMVLPEERILIPAKVISETLFIYVDDFEETNRLMAYFNYYTSQVHAQRATVPLLTPLPNTENLDRIGDEFCLTVKWDKDFDILKRVMQSDIITENKHIKSASISHEVSDPVISTYYSLKERRL